jgi:hypothetical protein
MKTRIWYLFPLAAALSALALAGCSTPATRIQKAPEVFAKYTPQQQDLIKQGKVAIGFDTDAVKLALGDPDRVRVRRTADGNSEIWSYVTYDMDDGFPLYRGYYHRYYAWGNPAYPWYGNYSGRRREHEHFRVVFDRTGKASLIEEERS